MKLFSGFSDPFFHTKQYIDMFNFLKGFNRIEIKSEVTYQKSIKCIFVELVEPFVEILE